MRGHGNDGQVYGHVYSFNLNADFKIYLPFLGSWQLILIFVILLGSESISCTES